nr:hypothetical protein [Kitasatospora sp. DSM 101779]
MKRAVAKGKLVVVSSAPSYSAYQSATGRSGAPSAAALAMPAALDPVKPYKPGR